jgi:apolipoprotein N-acyltransferase
VVDERTAPAAASSRAGSRSTGERALLVASAGAGVLFAACSPPIDFVPGVFLGLALFAVTLADAPGTGFSRGWLFGLGANLVALRFVPGVIARFTSLPLPAQWLALVLLAGAQAIPWGLGAIAARTLTPALLQIADVVGERGVSLVVALIAGLLADAVVRRAKPPLAVAGALVVLLGGYGLVRMRGIDAARARAPHARVALVQPGFDASDRWEASRAAMMIERLTQLTKSAEARGAELVVWPESAYPYTLPHAARRSPSGPRAVLQPGVTVPVLTGAYLQGGPYNSAVLATPDGALSRPYDKRHLLWFGETVPLADSFPWLRRVFARGTGLVPGHESVVFGAGPVRAAVLNCYEDTLPVAGREAMEGRPNLLVNVTNDAWFAGSAEGELHLRLAVLRAIETRRDLVRAVNRGPTSFVDAAGRVVSRYDDGIPGTLPSRPALLDGPITLYARFGDAPLVLLAAAAVLFARRQKTAGADPARDGRPSIE